MDSGYNQIKFIDRDAFHGLKSLRRVDLFNNKCISLDLNTGKVNETMLAVASVYCNWSEVEVGGSSVGSENFQTILAEKQKTVDELSSQLASKDLKIKQLEERIEELGQV